MIVFQINLVCKDIDSQKCLAWLITTKNMNNNEEVYTKYYQYGISCGLSDLKPISPHRKFIKVTNNDVHNKNIRHFG